MAERLHSAGIRTVAQLLKANPDRIAAQLDHKKVNADTVIEWQQQANLACRIPQLRGHDAQILVACGIFDPPALAAMTPDALWAIVRPFIKTPDCKRIIRNGKAPDKAEIQDWITWAQSARSLQAA